MTPTGVGTRAMPGATEYMTIGKTMTHEVRITLIATNTGGGGIVMSNGVAEGTVDAKGWR